MDRAMRIPFKVSTTTSNFMIGVTAAASAGVYLHRGYIIPGLAMPVMLGVLAGSLVGARISENQDSAPTEYIQRSNPDIGGGDALQRHNGAYLKWQILYNQTNSSPTS